MEEAGETSDPQHAPQEPAADGRATGPAGGPLVVIGIVLIVALVGLVAWMAGGDDVVQTVERADERFPEETTTVAPTVPGGDGVGGVQPPDDRRRLLPSPRRRRLPTAAHRRRPRPRRHRAAHDAGHHRPRADDAARTRDHRARPVGRRVRRATGDTGGDAGADRPTARPIRATTWRRTAASPRCARSCRSTVRSSSAAGGSATGARCRPAWPPAATRPGFGECVGNDGELLDDGSYQYIATDADGGESAAGGFVVGAAPHRATVHQQR